MASGNYVAILHNYAQKSSSVLRFEDLGSVGPPHDSVFTQRVVLNDTFYPEGVGKTKKEAKQNAAENALKSLNKQQDPVDSTADANYNCASGQQKEDLNQHVLDMCNKTRGLSVNFEDKSFQETNFIGIINNYCQKTNRSHTFTAKGRSGPPHKPRFFYNLMIDKKEYPVGEGKTAKEAKQKAAQLAWTALQEQSDYDSKVSVKSMVSEDEFSTPSSTMESQEPSSQSMPMSTSDSIIFLNSSSPSNGQMSSRSTASESDASSKWSTPTSLSKQIVELNSEKGGLMPLIIFSSLASPQSMSTGTSDSISSSDSSNSSKDQVKDKNSGGSLNETSIQPRFKPDFDIIKCLGHGAFGCVFKARHKLPKKDYAVKVVQWEEKCLREVAALSDLHHPNIVRYHTVWVEKSGYKWDDDTDHYRPVEKDNSLFLYIQMEICDDKTLKHWIDEKNTQSLQDSKRREESLSITQQIVSGVGYIHSKMLIHRDLKPANIMFGPDGEVKIGDFGLVTKDNDDDAMIERTEYRGTPPYMAPEQRKETTYDRKVDIFALGLIYFELLWKFSTGSERAAIWPKIRSQKFPTEFSRAFHVENQIITLMLCEKPEDRPEASTLKAELEKWAQILNTQKNVHRENKTI